MTRTRPEPDDFDRLVASAIAASEATIARIRATVATLRRLEREEARERARAARMPRRSALPLCGARCRDGHACRCRCLPWRGRCAQHGGLSTGPRTDAGRARVAAAQRERWARWRAARETSGAELVDHQAGA